MKCVIRQSYKTEYNHAKEKITLSNDKEIELAYFVNNIYKCINEMLDYMDYYLVSSLYSIFLKAKEHDHNAFDFIYKKYVDLGRTTCLTNTSDIISLFINIKSDIVKGG